MISGVETTVVASIRVKTIDLKDLFGCSEHYRPGLAQWEVYGRQNHHKMRCQHARSAMGDVTSEQLCAAPEILATPFDKTSIVTA